MNKLLGFLLVFVVGCGVFWKEAPKPRQVISISQFEILQTKYHLYKDLIEPKRDHNGAILPKICDSLLFNGIMSATVFKDDPADIEKYSEFAGKWQRRALEYGKCYPDESRSSISRDMLLGLYWFIWEHQRLDLAEELWAYGEDNNWIMGEGRYNGADTIMNSNMISLLAQMIFKMGGEAHELRKVPVIQFEGCTGFRCHLMVLQVLLEGRINGEVSAKNIEVLVEAAKRAPTNPLLQFAMHKYTDGNMAEPIRILLQSPRFPADRLPESKDVCTDWSTQRTEEVDSKSLSPCPEEGHQHTGGDFLFVAYLIIQG